MCFCRDAACNVSAISFVQHTLPQIYNEEISYATNLLIIFKIMKIVSNDTIAFDSLIKKCAEEHCYSENKKK
jgi:hypothetical protein